MDGENNTIITGMLIGKENVIGIGGGDGEERVDGELDGVEKEPFFGNLHIEEVSQNEEKEELFQQFVRDVIGQKHIDTQRKNKVNSHKQLK